MISENQLKQELIDINKHIGSVEQRISFRGKGRAGKWTAILIKAKARKTEILADINHENNRDSAEETEAFLKDYDEKEKIRKEKERVLALFNEYKENPVITIPIKTQKEKPNFSSIGDKTIKRNYEELKQAQREFDLVKLQSENRSPVGKGVRAGALQRVRNRLNLALFDVEHEPIVIDNKELRAEIRWLETIIEEEEVRIEELQAIIEEHERNFILFEKHGLIKPKT